MKKSGVNKSLVSIWARIKNIYNESPVHAAFSYPFVFLFFFIIIAILIEYLFENLGFDPRLVTYYLGKLFFLIPIWVLTGLFVSKRKLPYLLALIIGCAIIYIPYVVNEGYTNAARKAATKTLHAQTIKYISAEIQKCKSGESFFMNNTQKCPATAAKAVSGSIETMLDKNPFNSTNKSVRLSDNNINNEDVGYVSLSVSESNVIIKSCIDTPCKKEENRLQTSIKIK
ncbi:hypothetical protein IDH32_04490 [Pelagibacterales bacterium SAG-MED01]|nr:hypothetical protein [Pelagibacterales bacterium SAG-MED01]